MDVEVTQSSEDKNSLIVTQQFDVAMQAMIFQNLPLLKQAHATASNAFRNIDLKKVVEEDAAMLMLHVKFIEVSKISLQARHCLTQERYEKAYSIIQKGLTIIDAAVPSIAVLDNSTDDYSAFSNLLSFYFKYFAIILKSESIESKMKMDLEAGKYVDEVAERNRIYENYLLIDNEIIDVNSAGGQMMLNLRNTMSSYAESAELQVELLQDRNKNIRFLNPSDDRVFLIHGHGKEHLGQLKKLLKEHFNISPIVLIDEPNMGKTVIEKLEDFGKDCAFAFALVTPDDIVTNKGEQEFHARQNVLFELGWFIGRYGRKKVRIIKKRGTELPSDFGGLLTINFQDNVEEVFLKIKQELEDFGLINQVNPADTPSER